jgi:hypothetical protein
VNNVIRFIANRLKRAFLCCLLSTLLHNIVYVILRIIIRSKLLEIQESSVIGCYKRDKDLSFFLAFNSIITSVSFQELKK